MAVATRIPCLELTSTPQVTDTFQVCANMLCSVHVTKKLSTTYLGHISQNVSVMFPICLTQGVGCGRCGPVGGVALVEWVWPYLRRCGLVGEVSPYWGGCGLEGGVALLK